MPAMLDDPTAPTIHRVTGNGPPDQPGQPLPLTIQPRQVTLRDRTTIATLMPLGPGDHVPPRLLAFLCDLLNNEIRIGDTYPMMDELLIDSFVKYWFQNFAAIMLMGDVLGVDDLTRMENQGTDWKEVCMGSFYIKPNYPGRSSHICNGGFLVSNASRNRGVGKLMGEGYLEWAPKLGYVYSVFNLVYETNHASIRIWDSLGFKRIGRVKGCGMLRSSPGIYVDAIIYGRDLGPDSEDLVSEERFDKIRYYLKHQKYPIGADRAEKSRLRSAATHYHLAAGLPGEEEKLMLKDKEVIADQTKQYEIARQMHSQSHGGINKTTATIAEKYHWVRIKETVSLVIKNCTECKENNKVPTSYTNKDALGNSSLANKTPPKLGPPGMTSLDGTNTPPLAGGQMRQLQQQQQNQQQAQQQHQQQQQAQQQQQQQQQQQHHQQQQQQQQQQHQQHQQQQHQHQQQQQHLHHQQQQQQQQQPMSAFEQPLVPSMGGTPSMTHDVSSAHHNSLHQHTQVTGPTSMPMSQPVLAPRPMQQPPHHPHPGQLAHQSTMQSQMAQSIIPPHINNHNHLGMSMSSAHVTPSGSAVHSPLPSGPASAPISGMQQPFDITSLDPLLHGIQQYGSQDMSGTSIDDAMQSISHLDMDTNMQDLSDLNAMGLGDATVHGMADHSQLGQGAQAVGMGMGAMPSHHGGPPDGMLEHHEHHGHAPTKHEMPDFSTDSMMLDGSLDLSKPTSLG